MYCSLSVKTNTRKTQEDGEHTCFAFACVVDENPQTPKLSPMPDDAIPIILIPNANPNPYDS